MADWKAAAETADILLKIAMAAAGFLVWNSTERQVAVDKVRAETERTVADAQKAQAEATRALAEASSRSRQDDQQVVQTIISLLNWGAVKLSDCS